MLEAFKGLFAFIVIVIFLYTIIRIIIYSIFDKSICLFFIFLSIFDKNIEMGCDYDCKNCPFPECTDEEKKFKRLHHNNNEKKSND